MMDARRLANSTFSGAFLALTAVAIAACTREPSAPATPAAMRQTIPVTAAKVERRDVPEEIRTIGNVEAMSIVLLKPQVDGQLVQANFVEGQDVKAGDLLFTIDSRPFEAALAEAQAKLSKDIVMAEDAERAAQQMAEALKGRAMSQREADKARADADAARAQVESDKAAVEAAKLKVEYCSIKSPIDGRAGAVMVKPGNVVEANKTELVQINQIAPIYVSFAVPEQNLSSIRKNQGRSPLTASVTIPGAASQADAAITGTLTFIDNRVDVTTGTIHLKATFANEDRMLWPGQFVNVVLTLAVQPNVLVMPASAIQNGQKGTFVFVVKPDKTVEQRPVTVARRVGDLSVVAQGVSEGETVVTDGQLRLSPGATVEIKAAPTHETASAGEGMAS